MRHLRSAPTSFPGRHPHRRKRYGWWQGPFGSYPARSGCCRSQWSSYWDTQRQTRNGYNCPWFYTVRACSFLGYPPWRAPRAPEYPDRSAFSDIWSGWWPWPPARRKWPPACDCPQQWPGSRRNSCRSRWPPAAAGNAVHHTDNRSDWECFAVWRGRCPFLRKTSPRIWEHHRWWRTSRSVLSGFGRGKTLRNSETESVPAGSVRCAARREGCCKQVSEIPS